MPRLSKRAWPLAIAIFCAIACGRAALNAETPMGRFIPSHDGVPIAYDVQGAGKPSIVLIHGWSCDKSYWAAQLKPLAGSFQVITVDLAGHGQSGAGRKTWTIDSFGGDVAAVVEALEPEQVVLVGHSMGGDVAVAAARRLGERVKGVVWVDTYRKLGAPRSAGEVQELVAPFRTDFKDTTDAFVRGMFPPGADEGLVRRVAGDMSSAPPAIAVPALESSLDFGRTITETIRELNVPIIAINPDSAPSDIASMRRHGVGVVSMSGVGHFLMMEDPEGFNALLKQVVRDISGKRGIDPA